MAMLLPMLADPKVRKGMGKLVKNLLVFGGLGVGVLLFIFFVKKLNPIKAIENLFKKGFSGIGSLFGGVGELFSGKPGYSEFRPGIGWVDPYGKYGSKLSPEAKEKFYAYKKERTAETMKKLREGTITRVSLGR